MKKDENRRQNKLLPRFKVILACRHISTISWGNKYDNLRQSSRCVNFVFHKHF